MLTLGVLHKINNKFGNLINDLEKECRLRKRDVNETTKFSEKQIAQSLLIKRF